MTAAIAAVSTGGSVRLPPGILHLAHVRRLRKYGGHRRRDRF